MQQIQPQKLLKWILSLQAQLQCIALIAGIAANPSQAHSATPLEINHINGASLTSESRTSLYNDFLRVLWVRAGSNVDKIALGKRTFFTASSFFEPPTSVDRFLQYVGNYYRPGQDLILMRCIPNLEQRTIVQPILATWPKTFDAIVDDLGGPNRDCTTPGLTPGELEICQIAIQYQDTPVTVYTSGLATTLTLASQLFATPESTKALRDDYGIFPAFTGLGFTVQTSSSSIGDTVPMSPLQILLNSVIPEYLLKKASLSDAGCHCVQIPESSVLHHFPVDPNWIWAIGDLDHGYCRKLSV